MPKLRLPILLGLILLPAVPHAAGGQQVPSPYRFIEPGQEASVFGGVAGADRGQFGVGPGGGPLLGVRYGVHLSDALALEAGASYLDTTRDVRDPGTGEGATVLGEVPADLLFVDVRFRWSLTGRRTWNRLMPFAYAGGSIGFGLSGSAPLDQQLPADDRFEFSTEFGAGFGTGVRIHLREHWGLRVDGGLILNRINVPEGYSDPELGFEGVPRAEWAASPALTLGLSYLF